MAELKYSKYIVTEPLSEEAAKAKGLISRPKVPGQKPGGRLLWIDNDFVKGAFYMEVAHLSTPGRGDMGVKPHTHDHNEIIGFVGTNEGNPFELNGVVEFWLDDEKHVLTKNCLIFVPAGLKHCPYSVHDLKTPLIHFTVTNNPDYVQAKKFE